MRTLIILPAYNEELTIGSVVALAKEYGDVLVVDDGSSDRTSEIARESRAAVIKHEVNGGKGEALRTGFEYALSKGYDFVVTIDADGQSNPDEIPNLLDPLVKGEADLVIGSRFLDGAKKSIPLYRRLGLWVLNTATNVSLDGALKITDSQSGFRAMSREVVEEILGIDSGGYTVESEMLAHLSEKGVRIKEVPINVRYDVPNKHKKHPLTHGLGVLAGILSLIGYRRPLLFFSSLALVSFIIAGGLFAWALEPFNSEGSVYMAQAVGAGIFTIIGIQLFVAGLMLNVLAKMVRE